MFVQAESSRHKYLHQAGLSEDICGYLKSEATSEKRSFCEALPRESRVRTQM